MSWYDFGKTKDHFMSCLPSGKHPIDTGFYFQELMALGGWYFHPVPGSGQRRFYNRVYIDPTTKDREWLKLDTGATMFINLGKTNFGKLEIKITDNDLKLAACETYAYTYDQLKKMLKTQDEIIRITKQYQSYYDYITDKVVKSYIVLYVNGRNHTGAMFKTLDAAIDYGMMLERTLSAHVLNKYGIQIYKPHTENAYLDTLEGGKL